MISIEAYFTSIGRFYNRLRHFANAQNVVSIRSENVYIILLFLLFSLLYLSIILHVHFTLFRLVTVDVVYIKSVRFKHINSSCHFLGLNYDLTGYNLNVVRLKQLLIDVDIESNPGPTQTDCKFLVGRPKKIKVFKETAKKCDLTEMLLVSQRCRIIFSIHFNQSAQTLSSHGQLLAVALWSHCKNWNLR